MISGLADDGAPSGVAAAGSSGSGGGGADQNNVRCSGGGGSIENPADCTMIADEVGETFNGVETEEFNFAAALGLRKNLTASFDRHVVGEQDDNNDAADSGSKDGGQVAVESSCASSKAKGKTKGKKTVEFSRKTGGVRSRIMQLENAAKMEKKKATAPPSKATATAAGGACPKPRFGKKGSAGAGGGGGSSRPVSRPRPPMGRSRSKNNASTAASGKEGGSLLSVHLRIRPIPATSSSSDNANTIEIMATEDKKKKITTANNAASASSTTIRTYPPQNSNAAKVVRTHPSSDMIFGQDGHDASSSNSSSRAGGGGGGGVKEYKFNSIFGPSSTQDDVYRGVAKPLVDGLFPSPDNDDNNKDGSNNKKLVGQSALLFAYGITNAGKTHTIMGNNGGGDKIKSEGLHPDLGVIPRALHDILQRVKELGEDKYQVNLSYFEIYNEQCFDLIEPTASSSSSSSSSISYGRSKPLSVYGPVPLKLRESRDGRIFVKGLSRRKVESLEHGMELVRKAMKKRHTSSNNINSDSSRSHSICQLDIIARPQNPTSLSADGDDDVSVASVASGASGYNTEDEAASLRKKEDRLVSMWIVDLAGSERTKRTGTANRSARQKEAALINSSLMKLMRCLHTLRDNQNPGAGSSTAMVPFRESKLTHLFMNHLTGAAASRTSMIVNVNPAATDYDETQHVLSYATIAKSIVINEDEHDRKRRVGAMNAMSHTHDDNGRSLSRSKAGRVKSPPKKIARLASKLSPRTMLAKRREQQADAQMRKAQLQSMRGVASSSSTASLEAARVAATSTGPTGKGGDASNVGPPKRKIAKISSGMRSKQVQEKEEIIAKNVEEIDRLHSSLAASQDKAKAAQLEALRLKEQLSQREAEIRVEVAEEMEGQVNSMRDHYQGIIDRLKRQVGQTPGKSARKVRLDRAEAVIEELMDQVEECEEDMARTREVHEEQIAHLTRIHEDAITAKQSEVSAIKSYHEEALKMKEDDIARLREQVESLVNENGEIKRSRDELVTEYEELLRVERMIREETAHSGAEGAQALLEENKSPPVRRLRRERTSEVACSNAPPSPPRSGKSSSKKKAGLFRKIASGEKKRQQKKDQRQPLSPIPKNRESSSEGEEIESSYVQSDSSEYSDYE